MEGGGESKNKNTQMSRVSPTLEVFGASDERGRHGARRLAKAVTEAPPSGASAGTPGRDASGGDPCSWVHGGCSPLRSRPPSLNVVFPPLEEPIREEHGARETGGFKKKKKPDPGRIGSALHGGDELPASFGSARGRICNILTSVLLVVAFL